MSNGTVVIVEPVSTGSLLAPLVDKRGFDPVALRACQTLSAEFSNSFRPKDFRQIFGSTKQLRDWLSDNHVAVSAVIAGSETGVREADRLAEVIGAAGNPAATSSLRRDKDDMQAALKAQGLPHIPTYTFSSAVDGRALMQTLSEGAYVLKPSNGGATEGVLFFDTIAELKAAVDAIDWNTINCIGEEIETYLVQPFLRGVEYAIDIVVSQGTYAVSSIAEYDKISANGSKFVYRSLRLLDPKDPKYGPLIAYAEECLAALEVAIGPAHIEIMDTTETGPVLIEVGARLHGGIAPQLISHCYEPDLLTLTLDSYLSPAHVDTATMVANGRIAFAVATRNGVFTGLSERDLDGIRDLQSYRGLKVLVEQGAAFTPTVDLLTCPAIAWFSHPDPQKIEADDAVFRDIMAKHFGDSPASA
ncbi:MAG: ATP-grasp domain-containing protein [Rhodobacter sp.]|nr:ATP-grasp domain-containing protein [Rhodobacter sp.]